MTRQRSIAALALTMLCLPCAGWAQQAPEPADLYRDALNLIAAGRKTDAIDTLTRLIENQPLHAGAWLEVALLQCGLGNAEEAERLFRAIQVRFNPEGGILALIAEARKQGCQRLPMRSTASLTVGRGIEQNVNQGATNPNYLVHGDSGVVELPLLPDFLPKHDQYTRLAGSYGRDLSANGSVAFVQFQGRRNDHLRQYDSATLFAGVESPWQAGLWTVRFTGLFGVTILGDAYYQRQAELQARVTPPWSLPFGTQFSVFGSVARNQFLTLSNFDSSTSELRAQLGHAGASHAATASFGLLDDHASAQRPGGSRHGWVANLRASRPIGAAASVEVAYTQQRWHSKQPYSPGLIEEVRAQATHVLRTTLTYPLDQNHSLLLEGRLVHNVENISIFQYNNRLLQLSWQWNGH